MSTAEVEPSFQFRTNIQSWVSLWVESIWLFLWTIHRLILPVIISAMVLAMSTHLVDATSGQIEHIYQAYHFDKLDSALSDYQRVDEQMPPTEEVASLKDMAAQAALHAYPVVVFCLYFPQLSVADQTNVLAILLLMLLSKCIYLFIICTLLLAILQLTTKNHVDMPTILQYVLTKFPQVLLASFIYLFIANCYVAFSYLMMIAIFFCVYWTFAAFYYLPYMLFLEQGIFTAYRSSLALTKGEWWSSMMMLFLPTTLMFMFYFKIQFISLDTPWMASVLKYCAWDTMLVVYYTVCLYLCIYNQLNIRQYFREAEAAIELKKDALRKETAKQAGKL